MKPRRSPKVGSRVRASRSAAPGASQDSRAERILETALPLFAERGYRGTTTRALASAAGVNVATLAYHFGGKEGLYRAAIDKLYRRILSLEPAIALEGDAATRIEQLVRLVYGLMRAHPNEIRLLQRHVLEHGLLPTPVREGWGPKLFDRAEVLWAALGLPKGRTWRLDLQALTYLFARSAITDPADLAGAVSAADPHRAVEDHLCSIAQRVLLGTEAGKRR